MYLNINDMSDLMPCMICNNLSSLLCSLFDGFIQLK